jgi:hypothetical protein
MVKNATTTEKMKKKQKKREREPKKGMIINIITRLRVRFRVCRCKRNFNSILKYTQENFKDTADPRKSVLTQLISLCKTRLKTATVEHESKENVFFSLFLPCLETGLALKLIRAAPCYNHACPHNCSSSNSSQHAETGNAAGKPVIVRRKYNVSP